MKSILLLSLTIIFLFVFCENKTQDVAEPEILSLQNKLDKYFSALTAMGKFNGAIQVTKGREQVINKAYNLDGNPESSTYVTTGHQFDIHSVSKLMVRYLLLKSEQAGSVSRSNLLSDFIAGFPRGNEITLEMLLEHESGLPREFILYKGSKIDLDPEDVVELAKKEQLIFEPGTNRQYSNIGYQLIYFIIGKIANTSFEQHLTDELFVPLTMDNSGAHFFTKENKLKLLAINHEMEDTVIAKVPNIQEDEFKQSRIFSTTSDLIKFLAILQKDTMSVSLADKHNVIQHSGGSDGVRAHIYTSLSHKYSFALLANFDGVPFEKTIEDIVKMIEGKPVKIPVALNRKSIPLGKEVLEKYEGTYVFADMNNLELLFKAGEDKLIVFQDEEKTDLWAEKDGLFFENPKEPESFEFVRNEQNSFDVLMGWKGIKLKGKKK